MDKEMSDTEVSAIKSSERLIHEYNGEFIISKISCLGVKSAKTQVFLPVTDIDVSFYIKIWYKVTKSLHNTCYNISSLKTSLVRSSAVDIPQSMKMRVEIAVYYSDDTVYKIFKNQSGICVMSTEIVEFNEEITRFSTDKGHATAHASRIQSDLLKIKCQLLFMDHFKSPKDLSSENRLLSNLKDFVKDFTSLCDPSVLSDVTFNINGKSLPAHRSILAAHSPVLLKMLTSNFLESKTNTITIEDSSPDIFEYFLEYLYSGEIEDKCWDTIKELYSLADKYDVRTLKRDCAEALSSYLSVERVCEILKLAFDYGEYELKKVSKKFAADHFRELSHKDEWKELIAYNSLIGYEVLLNCLS